jgi:hypothetical protein
MLAVQKNKNKERLGESNRGSMGSAPVVRAYVHQRDHALMDFLLRTLQCWADILHFRDVFAVAAQSLADLVITRVTKVAAYSR